MNNRGIYIKGHDMDTQTFRLHDLVRLKTETGFENMPIGTVCKITKIESAKSFRYIQITTFEGKRAWVPEHYLEAA